MKTGLIFDRAYLTHEQYETHPERRERLSYTMDMLEEEGILDHDDIILIRPRPATRQEVLAVHSEEYLRFLEDASIHGGGIDPDTTVPPGLITGALLAAGGGLAGADAVLDDTCRNAFVLCRPPGHHATIENGGGFCYLNNAAILARYLQRRGLRRVMILDWDAHHGNGTQAIFQSDPSILFCSIHQSPLYPGTGREHEIGTETGAGFTVNMPIPPGSSDQVYQYLLREIIIPLAEEFVPDAFVISAGQDNHFTDPITGLALTAAGYASLMREICILADTICYGRVIGVLEGGYSVEGGLPYINLGIIAAMTNMDLSAIREPGSYQEAYEIAYSPFAMSQVITMVTRLKQYLHPHWTCFG